MQDVPEVCEGQRSSERPGCVGGIGLELICSGRDCDMGSFWAVQRDCLEPRFSDDVSMEGDTD